MYNSGGHTILYLTNTSPAKCEILYDSIVKYRNDQHCDKISVNNLNLVIKQQIASGKHFCISLTIAPRNVEIGMMEKLNTSMINIVIKSM